MVEISHKKDQVEGHSNDHILSQYDEMLENFKSQVLGMAGLVERQLVASLHSLRKLDRDIAESVVMNDDKINTAEVHLDEEGARILARQQPAARDLRMILSLIKTVNDLERIGDEACKIAEMSSGLSDMTLTRTEHYDNIQFFGDQVVSMLRRTLDAFARVDPVAALEIAQSDKSNDRLYSNIMRSLITYMMEDPRTISSVLNIIWVVRSLERVGDHAKNICQYIHYLVEGDDVRHKGLTKLAVNESSSADQ